MNWKVPLADLDYGTDEENAVLQVIRKRWLTMGELTSAFEEQFAAYNNVGHAVAVSNASVALHLACVALDIGPGDEVIVPSLTFVATANAVLHTGADVCFADIIGPDNLNISPQDIEAKITPRTKAIIVVHYAGYPCHMVEIMDIANRHDLSVIEDVAHAPGASLHDKALGTWGDIGCFSFFSNKNLATGEGGMLITDRTDLADRVRHLRSHGMTSLTWDRHRGHAYSYDVVALGFNYRLDEIHSALGLTQLQKLDANNERRRRLSQNYRQALAHTTVRLPFDNTLGNSACHIFPVLLPDEIDRVSFIDHMRSVGIQTSIHYPPIHLFQYYQQRYPHVSLSQTEYVASRELTLPLYPTMTADMQKMVISAVYAGLESNNTEIVWN